MTCQRYETEGMTGFPATPELGAHIAGCAECQAAEGSYARLEKLLAVPLQSAPPAGWEQRVHARLAQGSRRRFSLRSVAVVGSAVAAALIALLFFPRRTAEPLLSTQTELTASGGSRAATASVGGTWKVSVDRRQEVRVWRGHTLVLRCGVPSDGDCQAEGARRIANVPLEAPGQYRAMVLTPGAAPLAEPKSFDDDARLAREQGASYAVLEPIVVY